MYKDTLNMLKRIKELSPPTCKKCPQPKMRVADKRALAMKHFDKDGNLTVISYGLVPHPSGLCYYHLKESLGLFHLKFPLKNPSPKISDVYEEAENDR